MTTRWTSLVLWFVPALFVLPATCRADPVDLAIGGHLYDEYALYANTTVVEMFTLDEPTEVSTFYIESPFAYLGNPDMKGPVSITVTGPSAVYPDGIWAPGQYTITYAAGPCGSCENNIVGGLDYYLPPDYTEIGGTVRGNFDFTLLGETVPDATPVPEPASGVLLATALLCCLSTRRRLLRAT